MRSAEHAFTRRPGEQRWRIRTGRPMGVPSHIWDYPDPIAAREVGAESTGGVETRQITFFLRADGHPVWYRLWVDDDRFVRRAEMRAAGHFMDHRYLAFDDLVDIRRPVGAAAILAHERLGTRGGWAAAATVLRTAVYATALLTLGGMVFLRWIADPRGTAAWSLPQRWQALVASPTGAALAATIVGLLAALWATPRLPKGMPATLGLAGAGLAVTAFAFSGHSFTAQPAEFAVAANLVHLAAAAIWLGLLVLLGVGQRTWPKSDAEAATLTVRRASATAGWSLAALIPAGAVLAWVHGRTPEALAAGPYGWALLAKTGFVVAVIALAAYNNRYLIPRLTVDPGTAMTTLRRTVTAEALILTIVLFITAILTALPLPRP